MEYNNNTWVAGGDSNKLAMEVQVGKIFIVVAEERNVKGAAFYILKCLKILHVTC